MTIMSLFSRDEDLLSARIQSFGDELKSRKVLALVSTLGFIASISCYLWSFWEAPVDIILRCAVLLGTALVAVLVPMFICEYPRSASASFASGGFARGMPRWVVRCSQLLTIMCVAHFVFFFVRSGPGVPVIIDGEFVLNMRGRIIQVLSRQEYLALKADELRIAATMMSAMFFVPMTYWWHSLKAR